MPLTSSHLEIDAEADWTLRRIIDRSRRTSGVRLPAAFARGDTRGAPLARLLQGGRGGTVRLKLYLTMVLLAGNTHAHPTYGRNTIFDVSGRYWARALALPDAAGGGARRVSDAQNRLAGMGLIDLRRRASQPPVSKLLHPSGSGGPWVEPGFPYLSIPLGIWSNKWIWFLTAKELAVLIAIYDLCGGRGVDRTGQAQAVSGTHLRYYGLSADTWRIASADLERAGLIRTEMAVVGADLTSPRRRKRYQPVPAALTTEAPIDLLP